MQFCLQWYLVYVQNYEVKFATNAQVFSLYKSLSIFPLGFAKICAPQIFHGDEQEPISRSIKRMAWGLNFFFSLTNLFLVTFGISNQYLSGQGNNSYFLLPVAITSGFLLTILVFNKLFKYSWRPRLKCIAFTFWFLSIGTLGCQYVFTQSQVPSLSIRST